jgi:hypothetical protein
MATCEVHIDCDKCGHRTRIVWIRSNGVQITYRLACTNPRCRHNFEADVMPERKPA